MFQPTTFGKYFLTRRIAVGGMAEVFAAKLYGSDGFEKDLVIKQILPQHAKDPEFVQSFVAEAKIAVSLHHSNIVSVYELGRIDGTYFIAMEYVDGPDVFGLIDTARRNDRNIGVGLSILIAEEVARGLSYAHRKLGPSGEDLGLVHRDLNPRNVLLSKEGEVKILDFGIAKVGETLAPMPKTRAGVVKGTTGYMSPEQATGQDVDARTDIYQVGLLLYELLTFEPLFWRANDNDTRTLMQAHQVYAPSEHPHCKNVPPQLDQIVLGALEFHPQHRTQAAQDLATQLARLRFLRFPDVDHRALGELVSELSALDEVSQEESLGALPSTAELSSAFSGAFDPFALPQTPLKGKIETIATRAPSGLRAAQPLESGASQPVVQSEGLQTANARPAVAHTDAPHSAGLQATDLQASMGSSTADHQAADEAPALASPDRPAGPRERPIIPRSHSGPGSLLDQVAISYQPPPTDSESLAAPLKRPIWRWVWGWGLAGGVVLIALLLFDQRPTTATAPLKGANKGLSDAGLLAKGLNPEPNGAITGTMNEAVTKAVVETLDAGVIDATPDRPSKRRPKTNPKTPPKPPNKTPNKIIKNGRTGFATVAFGTRSCSSRVTVDGELITRSTPSFGHKIPAGMHRVVLEGTSCPPIERPGSLRRTRPTVSKQIQIEPGTTVKIIADFDREQVIVRR